MKPADKAPGGGGPGRSERKLTGTCPMCGKKTEREFRPFCSRRCADLDLARWLNGSYAIPGAPLPPGGIDSEPD
ncbi:MAG: hypothetical protein Kow0032_04060 [Methyloligellaceae bacterium]